MIVLNMIVKNEAHCIERCLRSARPFIDAAVIVDTGSTDGTPELVSEVLSGLEHSVLSEPWTDFSTCRNLALSHARQRYPRGQALLLDADEELVWQKTDSKLPTLSDHYEFWHRVGGRRYARPGLICLTHDWEYQGLVHEELVLSGYTSPFAGGIVKDFYIQDHFDSARNAAGSKAKALADAQLLESRPPTPRSLFYLGVSYYAAEDLARALHYFKLRVGEGGWEEEVWYSMFMSAKIMDKQDQPLETVLMAYHDAFQYRPSRAETLIEMSRYLHRQGRTEIAYELYLRSLNIPMTTDRLNVDLSCYP